MADEMSKNNKHSASTPNTTHMCIKQQSQHRFGWWLSLSFNIYFHMHASRILFISSLPMMWNWMKRRKKKPGTLVGARYATRCRVAPDALSSVLMNFEWFFVCMFGHDGKIFVRQTAIWTDTTNRNQFVEIWITPDYKWSLQRIETSQS